MMHPAVELAAAVGKPDAYAGELPIVFVSLRPGQSATAAELLEHARASIPERAAVPNEVIVREALPVTAVGKIFKPELRFEATRRVIEAALQGIAGDAAAFTVEVGPDSRHGTLARIGARELRPGARETVGAAAREALDRYSVRYEIEWR